MWILVVIRKILWLLIGFRKFVIDRGKYRERQREQFIEINEIKDWSKGENYFGNGRLF